MRTSPEGETQTIRRKSALATQHRIRLADSLILFSRTSEKSISDKIEYAQNRHIPFRKTELAELMQMKP